MINFLLEAGKVFGTIFILLCGSMSALAVIIFLANELKRYFKTLYYMIEYLFHRKDFIEWHKKQVENENR